MIEGKTWSIGFIWLNFQKIIKMSNANILYTEKKRDAGSSIVSWFIQEDKARESSRISNVSQAHSFL